MNSAPSLAASLPPEIRQDIAIQARERNKKIDILNKLSDLKLGSALLRNLFLKSLLYR